MKVDCLNVGADANIGSDALIRILNSKTYLNVGADANIGNEC
jgi:hypothetical protein